MSQSHVLIEPRPNEALEDNKLDSSLEQVAPNSSKLHQVLLDHMIKNSKAVESKDGGK